MQDSERSMSSLKMKWTVWVVAMTLMALCMNALQAANAFQEKVTGASFPLEVRFTHRGKSYTLEATGAAVRRKWFTNGYAIAHYIQDPVSGSQEIVLKEVFSDDKPKQMTILWLHRLPLKLIRDSFQESLTKVLGPADATRLKDNIEKFVELFKVDAEVQDRHDIRWLPGGNIELYRNDERVGSLINVDLAKALWSIWLGPDSVVDRQEMLQFMLKK